MQHLHTPVYPKGLPELEPELLVHLDQHHAALASLIQDHKGFLPYDQWMQAVLYAPHIGYYSGGSTKFHYGGDFTTAPELSPLFGYALAQQAAQILNQCKSTHLLEFGAGSGALAEAIISALVEQNIAVQYFILELSPTLRARQQARLAAYAEHIQWLDHLPSHFEGCVIANEVLDAMPVHLLQRDHDLSILELGVGIATGEQAVKSPSPFVLLARPASAELSAVAEKRLPAIAGYRSEINLLAEQWVQQMGQWLKKGGALLIDYGFSQHEFYHPQRSTGTLMCHFRHFAHDESLLLPGLQDVTAHVDFTAIADAALSAKLDVLGYTSQAHFLLNCGLGQQVEQLQQQLDLQNPTHLQQWTKTIAAVQTLVSESEMGELFKVIALSKDLDPPLLGFLHRDRRDFL